MNRRKILTSLVGVFGATALGATAVEASGLRRGRPILDEQPHVAVGGLTMLPAAYAIIATPHTGIGNEITVWLGNGPGTGYDNKGCPLVPVGAKAVLVNFSAQGTGSDAKYTFYTDPQYKYGNSLLIAPAIPGHLIMQMVLPIDANGRTFVTVVGPSNTSNGTFDIQVVGYYV